jgi:hypothetical protein
MSSDNNLTQQQNHTTFGDEKENIRDGNYSPQSSPGSPGTKLLHYISSEHFAMRNESAVVGDTI